MCKYELEHGSVHPANENEEITTQDIQNKSKITIYFNQDLSITKVVA